MNSPLPHVTRPPDPDRTGSPLLVLLHGYGADEHDLFGLADVVDPRHRVVSVQAPIDLRSVGFPAGFAWFHLHQSPDGEIQYDPQSAMDAVETTVQFIREAIDTYDCDPGKVRLLGFSQGSMLAHAIALRGLLPLAGVAAFSGRLVPELIEDPEAARNHIPEGLPVLIAHGTLDDLIPVAHGHALRDFYATTGADLTWIEEPIGHGIGPAAAEAIRRWLQEDDR